MALHNSYLQQYLPDTYYPQIVFQYYVINDDSLDYYET